MEICRGKFVKPNIKPLVNTINFFFPLFFDFSKDSDMGNRTIQQRGTEKHIKGEEEDITSGNCFGGLAGISRME